jgi:hypothetical protein
VAAVRDRLAAICADPSALPEIAARARAHARARFTWAAKADRVAQVYARILGRPAPPVQSDASLEAGPQDAGADAGPSGSDPGAPPGAASDRASDTTPDTGAAPGTPARDPAAEGRR